MDAQFALLLDDLMLSIARAVAPKAKTYPGVADSNVRQGEKGVTFAGDQP